MKVKITNAFKKAAKKLMRNQISLLEDAIDEIIKKPKIGEMKNGDLTGVRVYKFDIHNQEILLAYSVENEELILLSLGSHENFYRNLKKSTK